VIDSKGFKNVTPKQGAVYADKWRSEASNLQLAQ
jgi:hypothetical protein